MTKLLRAGALGGLLSFVAKVALATTIFLTSGTTWTAPADFDPVNNTVQIIGAGGHSGTGSDNSGGGGAYVSGTVSVLPNQTVNIGFDGPTTTVSHGTWFISTGTLYAESGHNGDSSTLGPIAGGGRASASIGTVKFSGGGGGACVPNGGNTGGGGGAAGPHGAGNGVLGGSSAGGSGDAGFGGAGGSNAPTAGGNGTEFDASHGSGGGGGSTPTNSTGSVGGLYGGGGACGASTSISQGGLIVISYSPHSRVSTSVF